MNKKSVITIGSLSVLLGFSVSIPADTWPEAQAYTTGSWLTFGCRTLDSIDGHSVNPTNLVFSKYGGWKARQVAATGFFRVEKVDGRWSIAAVHVAKGEIRVILAGISR